MTIEEAIQAHLVVAVASKTSRVYQSERPQDSSLPAVAWDWLPGGESFQDMTAGSVGLAQAVVQINHYATTAKAAAELRELTRLAFQNHINAVMGGAGGVHVWACRFSGTSGGFEPETGHYVRSVDFELDYAQALS